MMRMRGTLGYRVHSIRLLLAIIFTVSMNVFCCHYANNGGTHSLERHSGFISAEFPMAMGECVSKNVSLDGVLNEIDKRFIAIQDPTRHFKVFKGVFDKVHEMMKQVDPYYGTYSSTVQYVGSFSDGIKVGQLDDFDMDIVIRLPIDYDEIEIEEGIARCVRLKVGSAFDKLRTDSQYSRKLMASWLDENKYFLQRSFRFWMVSVMDKAMNALNRIAIVDGNYYKLSWKKSRPSFTISTSNENTGIKVDVDMLPVIQFSLPRWPNRHRLVTIPGDSNNNSWFVVPKRNYNEKDIKIQNRCWRLAFHNQEREIIKNYKNLKPTLRLLKKLRDSLEMNAIDSYYIKTLFLWKLYEANHSKKYWENKQSVLFADMVQELYNAVAEKKILHFWKGKGSNLLHNMNEDQANQYKARLYKILQHIKNGSIIDVAKVLLTHEEFVKLRIHNIF